MNLKVFFPPERFSCTKKRKFKKIKKFPSKYGKLCSFIISLIKFLINAVLIKNQRTQKDNY